MNEGWTLRTLAERVGGMHIGDGAHGVRGVASPTKGREGMIVCLWDAGETSARRNGALMTDTGTMRDGVFFLSSPDFFARHPDAMGVAVENPKNVFPLLLSLFARTPRGTYATSGIHSSAVVSGEAVIAPSARIGPLCIVEAGAVVEEGAYLYGKAFVGAGCTVGAESVLEPGVVLFENVRIGRRCLIHSNAIIGCDGFGVAPSTDGTAPRKIPQLGGVVLGDDVEVVACTTIDRGTLDDTEVGSGTKIDNHVHIAHNVQIGANCVIVAMTGIAGSAVLEDAVIMAAGSGVKEHTRIGKGATVAAKGGAIKDVPPGEVVSGFPARPHRENFRVQAALQRLPEMISRVKELEKRLESISPPQNGRTDRSPRRSDEGGESA